MPFLTVPEIKSIIGLSGSDKDALITTLIPQAFDQFHKYSRNYFLNTQVQFFGSPVQFIASNKKIIKLSSTGYSFVDCNFKPAYYKVTNSLYNDKVIEVTEVSDYELTCSNDTFIDENTDNDVIITKVDYPDSLKVDLSFYIGSLLNTAPEVANIQSETLPGGYSVTYRDEQALVRFFKKYRIPY